MSKLLAFGWAKGCSSEPDPPLTQVSVLSPNNHYPTPPNGPSQLPGLIGGSGRMIGERLSSSGTRLDSCSPLGLAKSSTESLKPRPLKSVSKQSLLDIFSSKLGVSRRTPHQRFVEMEGLNVCSKRWLRDEGSLLGDGLVKERCPSSLSGS